MRLTTLVCAGLLTLGATAARAAAEKDTWLIRTGLEQPTAADVGAILGVDVTSVEQVDGTLYKVRLDHAEASLLETGKGAAEKVLRDRIAANAPEAITHIQRNFVYHIPLERPAAALEILKTLDAVPEAVVDNPAIQAPNPSPARGPDPKMSAQWGLTKIGAQQAWNVTRGDKSVVVAVIDTGIDYNHEDLRGNLWRNPGEIAGNGIDDDGNGFVDDVVGWDFADNDPLPFDKMSAQRIDGNPGHGTHCSGVVGAVGNNALGTSGVAPNITVMGLRFITDKGEGTTADAIKAINYAVKMGVKIISNSWGGELGDEGDAELKATIETAGKEKGVLFLFAAGNGRNGVGYDNDRDAKPMVPASFDSDNIVSIAATDSNNALAAFSNWGKTGVDLAAPGVKIMSTVPGSLYEDSITIFGIPLGEWSGTSMATPHVAGATALIWSQHPGETYQQIKQRLLGTVTPVAALSSKIVTGGVLNVQRAVQ